MYVSSQVWGCLVSFWCSGKCSIFYSQADSARDVGVLNCLGYKGEEKVGTSQQDLWYMETGERVMWLR